MNTKTKFAAALTALALTATLALPSQAEARGRGWAIGAGLVGAGLIAGSIAAANANTVYVGGYRKCTWVANYDRFGNFLGNSKVCRVYY